MIGRQENSGKGLNNSLDLETRSKIKGKRRAARSFRVRGWKVGFER